MQVRQAHSVSCLLDYALESDMPRFQTRTFHGVDTCAYLRHAMVDVHFSVQQNLRIIISLHWDTAVNRAT